MTPKFIMVASSKGGVGKSTAAIGIARALCDRGGRVLIADLDFGNACLDMLFGVQDSVVGTLQDVCRGNAEIERVLIKIEERPQKRKLLAKKQRDGKKPGELWLLPSSVGGIGCVPGISGELGINDTALSDALRAAAEHIEADYVMIDTGAGFNSAVTSAARVADTALVVAGQMPVALRSAQTTGERLATLGVKDIRLVINSFDCKGVISDARKGLFGIIDESRAPLAGVIPYDYGLMLTHEGLVSRDRDARIAFANIAARLCRENVPLFNGIKRLRKLKNKICL